MSDSPQNNSPQSRDPASNATAFVVNLQTESHMRCQLKLIQDEQNEWSNHWYLIEDAWKKWRKESNDIAPLLDAGGAVDGTEYAKAVVGFRTAIENAGHVEFWDTIPSDDPSLSGAVPFLRDMREAEIGQFFLSYRGFKLGTEAFNNNNVGMLPKRIWDLWASYFIKCRSKRFNEYAPTGPTLSPDETRESDAGRLPDAFAALREFAHNNLKGQERAVIEALCDANGELPIANLAHKKGVNWDRPFPMFKYAQDRLNKEKPKPKIKKIGWRLDRVDNNAKLVKVSIGAKEA
jgi:hypothetical protein